MRPELIIRPLESSDRAGWEPMWQAYLAFYKSEVANEVSDLTFARNVDPACSAQQCFVADLNGKLVGFTHYIFHAHNWRAEDVVYLQDLYADPAVRGQGIGRKLIEAVYSAADNAGCPSVYWMTQEFNYQGRMLYDRIGTKTPFIKYSR